MMERRWAWLFASVTLAAVYLSPTQCKNLEFLSDTLINNVVADPQTGRLYVGAVNSLHQLNHDLEVESRTETGPRRDDRQCTPPVTDACEEARDTDNHNKLLLVHKAKNILVVCGSVFRGICSLRNLSNVEKLLYFSDSKGEKSYVASAEESVSVVGVMSYFSKDGANYTVFLVGKGYGSHDSTKLISTRILQDYGDWVVFDSIIEASAVQANPFVLRYLHDFRFSFKDGGFVYFLFSRTLGVQDTKNFTFISRMCEDDQGYYSYTELQLNCSATNKFNKAQAAYVAAPGEFLAQRLSESDDNGQVSANDKVLFVTFTSDEDPSMSAMCMYPLSSINKRLVEIIGACYSDNGIIKEKAAVYSPYSSKSEELCSSSSSSHNLAVTYKCGAEFLPSPLASKADFALKAETPVELPGHMTAVAVAVEMGHAVAFLGMASGEVERVHLSAGGSGKYGRALVETGGDKVNKNLLFDSQQQHLYITTEKKITKVPVQACHLMMDCQSCVSMKDPYCGWCVLEGKCTRKQDCSRSMEENTWLWSPNEQCVQIQAFSPPNLSCKKTQMVDITIPALPRLRQFDRLKCEFGSYSNDAVIDIHSQVQVTCSLPHPGDIPPTPDGQDYVSVPVRVLVNDRIVVASNEYHFYNCAATVRKNPNTPCIACVTSEWGCQWNAQDHSCSDSDDAEAGSQIVKPQKPDSCPQFESPEPLLIPVGYEIPISFQGKNLDYMGQRFTIGTELMKSTEKTVIKEQGSKFKFMGYEFSYDKQQEVNVSFHIKDRDTERKIDSTLTVVLYNCSVGREDCSLCKHADSKYQCVWCAATRTCVYRELCLSPQPAQCPNPEITDIVPRYGPLNGRISVTIKGSNMGIKKEDIKKITVAGVDCVHQQDKYSVSTSVVCEIGPARRAPPSDVPFQPTHSGAVEIEVEGGRTGRSQVFFTYRVRLNTLRGGRGLKCEVECVGTLQVLVHGEGPDVTPVKVLNCDTISQVKEKIIDQVYRNLPYSQRPKVESVALEWRPGSTGQILSDLDLTSQKEGRWKRLNTLAHYNESCVVAGLYLTREKAQCRGYWLLCHTWGKENPVCSVRDNATLVLSRVLHTQSFHQHQDSYEEKNALLEDDNTFHLVRPADELDEVKSKRGSMKDKAMTKAITEIYLTRLLSVKGTLQQFVCFMCSCVHVPQGYSAAVHVFMFSCVHVFLRGTLQQFMCSCFHVFMCSSGVLCSSSCVHVFLRGTLQQFMCSCVHVFLRGTLQQFMCSCDSCVHVFLRGTLQQFVDDFFRSVLGSSSVVPPAVKYFFDFLDEQALRHDNVDEETLHIWKTNSLPLRYWVNILRNPHFIFDVHVTEVVDASLHVISQTFMDACTKTEHKLSRESPSNKLLYAKEISTYKKMVDDYYKGIKQMVPVSDQDMNTHLAEVSRQHTDKLNTQVALHQLYQYASKYYDVIIQSLDEDPAAQNKQLTLRLQQIAAALENKVTDL
ncbi:plexin-B2-like [Notolabrus celidotus]|uniref:plexin-B2-like n=1 Tax=Notolabrus celidotus TaxID=1203425 RepID=UPI00148F769F|nr:plexin-B2-like [Notolabrus celidotus]